MTILKLFWVSGNKWYVGDGLHLGSLKNSWTGEMGENGQSFAEDS